MNRDGSVSDPSQIAAAIRKMQEDPLFLIKKKEADHHKSLVDNPLIRERVRQMVRAEKEKDFQSTSSNDYNRPHTDHKPEFYSHRDRSSRPISRSRSPPRPRRYNDEQPRYRDSRSDRRPEYSDRRKDREGHYRDDHPSKRYRRRSRSRSRSSRRYDRR